MPASRMNSYSSSVATCAADPTRVVAAKYVFSSSTVKMRLISSVNSGIFSAQSELESDARR
jgi:hypothetical protein